MKKTIGALVLLSSIFIVAVICFENCDKFSSCGNENNKNIVGTYSGSAFVKDNQFVQVKLVINKDNSFIYKLKMPYILDQWIPVYGMYKVDGKSLILNFPDGTSNTLTIQDKQTIIFHTMQMTLIKD